MTYEDLKVFCNNLTEEQLKQEVYLARTDDAAIKVESAIVSDEDEYFDHVDHLGNLQDIQTEYPNEWQDVIDDATLCPKGTVMLCDE